MEGSMTKRIVAALFCLIERPAVPSRRSFLFPFCSKHFLTHDELQPYPHNNSYRKRKRFAGSWSGSRRLHRLADSFTRNGLPIITVYGNPTSSWFRSLPRNVVVLCTDRLLRTCQDHTGVPAKFSSRSCGNRSFRFVYHWTHFIVHPLRLPFTSEGSFSFI